MAVEIQPARATKLTPPKMGTNEPTDRGRYTIGGRERVVWGQRVEGRVCLTDGPPAGQRGRCYLIEDDLTVMDEVDGIVADYLAQANKRHGIAARVLWLA